MFPIFVVFAATFVPFRCHWYAIIAYQGLPRSSPCSKKCSCHICKLYRMCNKSPCWDSLFFGFFHHHMPTSTTTLTYLLWQRPLTRNECCHQKKKKKRGEGKGTCPLKKVGSTERDAADTEIKVSSVKRICWRFSLWSQSWSEYIRTWSTCCQEFLHDFNLHSPFNLMLWFFL